MVNMIIQGIQGRMGRAVLEKIRTRTDCAAVAGVDRLAGSAEGTPVVTSLEDLGTETGVVIDFSAPEGAVKAARYCAGRALPCVICTTGLDAAQEAELRRCAARAPVFRSANMSLGVNVLIELTRRATQLLGGEFDIEIVEKHHRNKLDAPSGTALMLANAVNSAAAAPYEPVYDRHAVRQKRGDRELGISSVRGGGIVGEHEVLFCGPEETLTLSHSAQSRAVFADGAVQAALFVASRPAGYYTMEDLIREKLQ